MPPQHLQALPRHHPVQPCHVGQRGGALLAHLDPVVVQRPRDPRERDPRVRVRQRQADHRHPDHVLAAVERRVDLLGAVGAHQRGEVAPVHALTTARPVQQETLPAVGTLPRAFPVRGQVPPDRRGVGAGGRGQDPAQRQHVLRFRGLRELAQHSRRAAQVVQRQPRVSRHVSDRDPAVGAAPPDLGRRQRGPITGVFDRDHVRPAAPRAARHACSRERG